MTDEELFAVVNGFAERLRGEMSCRSMTCSPAIQMNPRGCAPASRLCFASTG
jgi:hypothetical protein